MTSLPITYAEDEPAMTNDPDSVHPSAADAVAVSVSDVPARPTSPAEDALGMTQIPVRTLGRMHDRIAELERQLAASPPLPQEQGAVPLTDNEIQKLARVSIGIDPNAQGKTVEITMDRQAMFQFARSIEAAHGISAPPVADPRQAQMGETK